MDQWAQYRALLARCWTAGVKRCLFRKALSESQITLYIPAPYLRTGKNTVYILELDQKSNINSTINNCFGQHKLICMVSFVDTANLDGPVTQ